MKETNKYQKEKDFAGAVIEREDGKMLFQLRDDKPEIPNQNKWWIFGGGIEPCESPSKAVVRELDEEINLKIKENELRFLYKKPLKTKTAYFYKLVLNNETCLKLKEGQAMEFMSREEILNKPNVSPILKEFMYIYPILK